jgi:hypothetical protein
VVESFAMVVFIKQLLEFAVHLDRRINFRDRSPTLMAGILLDVCIGAMALWVWLSVP